MDLVGLNNRQQCRPSIVLVVLTILLGLCGRSMSQISGSNEIIGCVDVNMTRTCFHIYNSSVSWSDAWSRCQGNDTQLALLETPETNRLVGQYMDRMTANFDEQYAVWIGGRELTDDAWNWTNGKPFVMQNTSTMLTLFSTMANRYENCATVEARQTDSAVMVFQSSQCKAPHQFICQGPNTTWTTTCKIAGKNGTVINSSCYAIVSSDSLSWFDARYQCQLLGADLAVFDETSSSDRDAIYALLPNATFFWIGLRKNPWIWVTGFDSGANVVNGLQKISYSGWESDVPIQKGRSCLGMDGRSGVSHGWVNLKCDEPYAYICQQTEQISLGQRNVTSAGGTTFVMVIAITMTTAANLFYINLIIAN